MKKILLVAALFAAFLTANAQTTIALPAVGTYCSSAVSEVQGDLTLYGGSSTSSDGTVTYMTITVDASSKTSAYDATAFTTRLKLGGAGYSSSAGYSATPTQRYVSLTIPAGDSLVVDFISSSGSASSPLSTARNLYITDGTTQLATGSTDGSALTYIKTSSVSAATTVYIFGDAGINIYRFLLKAASPSSITSETADKGAIVSTTYYDITGREVSENATGLILKKVTYENGSSGIIKSIVKK